MFECGTSGQERVVYSFKSGKDGAYPYAALAVVDGALYGTTYEGGSLNWGTVFKVATDGGTRDLCVQGREDGAYPFARLLEFDGKLYGTTQGGGVNGGWGTVFGVAPSATAFRKSC